MAPGQTDPPPHEGDGARLDLPLNEGDGGRSERLTLPLDGGGLGVGVMRRRRT